MERFWKGAGNLAIIVSLAAASYEYGRLLLEGGASSVEGVSLGLSIYFGLIIAGIAALITLNWSVVKYLSGARKRARIKKENADYQEKIQTLHYMQNIQRDFGNGFSVPFDHEFRPPEIESKIDIFVREMERLQLAPPENSTSRQWKHHIDRLMPFIDAYGVDVAREEMKNWYSTDE